MEIRKGPYGHFVIKKIEDIDSVHCYTREIIEENISGHMLPLYIIPTLNHYEASYDFSGLVPLNLTRPSALSKINKLRKALGDLLLFIADLPDYLLAPSSVTLDDRYIFSDEDYSDLKVCFDPCKVEPGKLNISSLIKTGLRDFLNSETFTEVLDPDEIDGIIYASEQNDSELLKDEANRIKEPIKEETNKPELLDLPMFKLIMLLSILSLIFSITGLNSIAIIIAAVEVFFIVKLRRILLDKPQITIPKNTNNTKKQMLFGGDSSNGSSIDALILTSKDPVSGTEEKKAIYTDKAAIGSDRFLCDIYSPDKELSPIHAQIKKVNRTYYVSDLSTDNSTFLNNVRLEPGREYEIKSDQTLMLGRREFKIEII